MTVRARSRASFVGLGVLAGLLVGVWLAFAASAPEQPSVTPGAAIATATADFPQAQVAATRTVAVQTPTQRAASTAVLTATVASTPKPSATNTLVPTVTSSPTLVPTLVPSRTPTRPVTLTPTRAPTMSATPARAPTRTAIPSTGKLAPVITRGTSTSVVALTFDLGGTDAGATAHVLDTLKAYGYHATFFLTGQWTAANPTLVKRIVAEGHEIANHTYDHPHLTEVGPDAIRSQVTRTEAAILKAAGVPAKKLLRPPFGSYDLTVRIVLGEMGYQLVWWSIDSGDWRGFTPDQIVARAATAKAGDIFVSHAYATNTGQAIDGICRTIKSKGLKGGTLSQALGR